jgi:glutamate synthase (NADPH/NADH) small chain
MGASKYEQELATSKGVVIRENLKPLRIDGNDKVTEVQFERTEQTSSGLVSTGEIVKIPADQVFRAIGQKLILETESLEVSGNKIVVTENGRTSVLGVWAGGDCISSGEDLTVTAVAQGRDAAEDINNSLER